MTMEPKTDFDAARAWKRIGSVCGATHWLLIGDKYYCKETYTEKWYGYDGIFKTPFEVPLWAELSTTEVQRLVDECMAAMQGK